MNKRELLENYRDIVIEIETLERQSKFLNQFIGGPRPVHAVQLTGMPRGTNDPEAAMLQRADYEKIIQHLTDRTAELNGLMMRFELIYDRIKEPRARIIIRDYYANCLTDEQIAENMGLSQTTVNDIRNKTIDSLD